MNFRFLLALFITIAIEVPAVHGDFFKIESVKFQERQPKDTVGVWKEAKPSDGDRNATFCPSIEVKVRTAENIRSKDLFAKAYFYNEKRELIAKAVQPSKAGQRFARYRFELPVLFKGNEPARLFFEVPGEVRKEKWTAVIVFGDRHEVEAACYPKKEDYLLLDFPEKKLAFDKTGKKPTRNAAMDPLIEYVVHTRSQAQPKITLFLRPPSGVTDAKEVKGVLAISMLAGNIEIIKRALQQKEMTGDYSGLLSFANRHKLAVLIWGSNRLWDPSKNYDQMTREAAAHMDQTFDVVADAWERGVKELSETYGIPDRDFLLWGACGSAQWAQRLCLRKPDYFLAVNIIIPGSFDKPTPEAAKVLWCLTTGELYGGYERSNRFVRECRDLGYPMVYKAIPGMGHDIHPLAKELGFKFFEFALEQKSLRDQYDAELEQKKPGTASASSKKSAEPWIECFRNPPYYGDMINQEIFPAKQVENIPPGFRVALPTKELAKLWNGKG